MLPPRNSFETKLFSGLLFVRVASVSIDCKDVLVVFVRGLGGFGVGFFPHLLLYAFSCLCS